MEPAPGLLNRPDVIAESVGTETVYTALDEEEIARLAYSYWEARGFERGSALDDWLRAEEEIRRREAQAL